MKLLRFSFFLSLVTSKKNLKKALIFINIGIFLSLFAATTAFISLYFESKINDQEFKVTTFQNDLHKNKIQEEFIQRMINSMVRDKNQTRQDLFNQQLLIKNSFFSKAISRKDIYELEESPEGYAFFTNENFEYFDDKLKNFLEFGSLPKHQLKDLKEINLDHHSQDQDPENEVYDKFAFTYYFLDNISKYFEFYLLSVRAESYSIYLKIDYANQEIIKYSKYEKTSIFIAFILQLIVFLIIQFFEIGAARRKI